MGQISQSGCEVSLGTSELSIFRSPHGRMGCGKKTLFDGVTFLRLQSPMPLNPVLKEVQLGFQQSQKQGRFPELPFHDAAMSSSAFRLIQIHLSIAWLPHDHELCGHRGTKLLKQESQEPSR